MNLTVIKTIFFSLFFLFFFQFAKGQELLNPLLDSLSVVSSESEKSRISLKIALELYNTDWERSQYYLDVAEESALVSEDPKAYADFSKIVGDIFHEKQALDISLKYYLKAYEFYKDTDLPKKYIIESRLSVLYAQVEDFDDALFFCKLSYENQKKQKDSLSLAKSLNNIGLVYFNSGINLDSSIVYFKKALKIAQKININVLYFHLYTNLARVFTEKEQYPEALSYIKKGLLTVKNIDSKQKRAWFYRIVSEFYLKQSKIDTSIYFANKAFRITDSLLPYSIYNLKSVDLLYNSYRLNKEFEKATNFFEIYNEITDSINIEEQKINVEKILIQEEYKTKEKIQLLKEDENLLLNLLNLLVICVLLLILVALVARNKTKLKNIQLEKVLILKNKEELNKSLEIKNKELIGKTMVEIYRTEAIDEILDDLKKVQRKVLNRETKQNITLIINKLEKNTKSDIWQEFEVRFKKVHQSFYKSLFLAHPYLTSKDKRLCALLTLNLSTKEISQITGQPFKTVENSRTRLRKKLNITNLGIDLSIYLSTFN